MRRLSQRVVSDKHGGDMWRCGVHMDSILFTLVIPVIYRSFTGHLPVIYLVYPALRFSCRPMVPKQPALKWAAWWATTKARNWWERWASRSRCWSACWEKHRGEPWLLLYINIYIYSIYNMIIYVIFLIVYFYLPVRIQFFLHPTRASRAAESCCEICKIL